ncbi:MAG: hypothetical protein K0R62_2822 [Nonomuraea muscovyensis]|nr:hypothetical protein [Nonomuraea muscovyensis]
MRDDDGLGEAGGDLRETDESLRDKHGEEQRGAPMRGRASILPGSGPQDGGDGEHEHGGGRGQGRGQAADGVGDAFAAQIFNAGAMRHPR